MEAVTPNKKTACGVRRRYQKEDQVKATAKALNMAYHHCKECQAYHLGPSGKSGEMQMIARGYQ